MSDDIKQLRRAYPEFFAPYRCDNGCGVVFDVVDGFRSYKRDERGERRLICQCCAAEEGHLDEEIEKPEEAPVCRRKPKTHLKGRDK